MQQSEKRPVKYILVTGGVVSSLGKGLAAASIGALLEGHGYKVALQKFDPYINVDPDRVALDHVGLNHLTWTRRVFVDGVDVLPDLLDSAPELLAPSGLPLALLRSLGVWPSYYLRFYYAHDAVVAA